MAQEAQATQRRGQVRPPHRASRPGLPGYVLAARDVWVLAPRWSRTIIATASPNSSASTGGHAQADPTLLTCEKPAR